MTGTKKPPTTEGHCSRMRAIVESCLSQLTVRSSQTASWPKTELLLLVGEGLKRITSLTSRGLYRLLLQCDRVPQVPARYGKVCIYA